MPEAIDERKCETLGERCEREGRDVDFQKIEIQTYGDWLRENGKEPPGCVLVINSETEHPVD